MKKYTKYLIILSLILAFGGWLYNGGPSQQFYRFVIFSFGFLFAAVSAFFSSDKYRILSILIAALCLSFIGLTYIAWASGFSNWKGYY